MCQSYASCSVTGKCTVLCGMVPQAATADHDGPQPSTGSAGAGGASVAAKKSIPQAASEESARGVPPGPARGKAAPQAGRGPPARPQPEAQPAQAPSPGQPAGGAKPRAASGAKPLAGGAASSSGSSSGDDSGSGSSSSSSSDSNSNNGGDGSGTSSESDSDDSDGGSAASPAPLAGSTPAKHPESKKKVPSLASLLLLWSLRGGGVLPVAWHGTT